MRIDELLFLLSLHAIPLNAKIQSDSGWEGWATDCNGLFYDRKHNILIFTQDYDLPSKEYKKFEKIKYESPYERN